MIIYEALKTDFLADVDNDVIADKIKKNLWTRMHRHVNDNEYRSFSNSLLHMLKVLRDDQIPNDCGIAIEYNIPQTSKRIDILISGKNALDKPSIIIIELKQWDSICLVDSNDALVETYLNRGMQRVVHPSYQAWSYSMLIKEYNEEVQNRNISISPCAYLHNYVRKNNDPIDNLIYKEYTQDAPVFTKHDVVNLRNFIKSYINKGDKLESIYYIDKGKIKPSKSLQDSISNMIKGNREFIMIDDQKIVYENIVEQSKKSKIDNKKRVIIVKGGPGTGKTVVAINLLSTLTNLDQFCQYATKNSAPRDVFKSKLTNNLKKSRIDIMFQNTSRYYDSPKNAYDTILVDEAHRLNEKSGIYSNLGENQIKEIIHSAKCSVFFIDEKQKVTTKDIGSIDEIIKWANYHNAEVYMNSLSSQFRCNGSDGYLAWIDNVLEIQETANFNLDGINYDVKVFDSVEKLRDVIFDKNKTSNKARLLAGYCWNWYKDGRNNPNHHDIAIGDFSMSWNLGNTSTYAIDEDSVNEIGCIHTSQGLEFDYVGVIIGDDMRFDNNKIVTDFTKRAKTDQSIKGLKTMYKNNKEKALKIADEIIKNTYRTLLTRGMKGCYIYCTDKGLQTYLKERIGKENG